MEGYIKTHRKIMEWEWYQDGNTYRLFMHCLYKANWSDKKWKGEVVERGVFITSVSALSKELNLTTQQIRTSLKKLEKSENITRSTKAGNFSKIKVLNYNEYQGNNITITKQQQNDNITITTTNNIKNNNNKRNIYRPVKKQNSFNNFEQRNYDFEKLERKLINGCI